MPGVVRLPREQPMSVMSFEPLDPVAFLVRSAHVHGDRLAVVDGERRRTYAEFADRCWRMAGALDRLGVQPGDPVAVLAPNVELMLEAHYGVPAARAVLVAMNTRLADRELAYVVEHADARVLLYDHEMADMARQIAAAVPFDLRLVQAGGADDEYERLLAEATPLHRPLEDETSLLSLNYTSGTTGRPKGVMYHYRGAYLQALAMAYHLQLDPDTVSLWTLPMFHCNGWSFPWAVTAAGGAHVCLRKVDAGEIWRLIRSEGVNHFNGAPTVLLSVAYDPAAEGGAPQHLRVGTGGAPPSPAILARLAELRIDVTHLYGLTETFGPAVVCEWHPEWRDLPLDVQARLKSRQGVSNVVGQQLRVLVDGKDAPADGATLGELALRGNNVMLGYYRDEEGTRRAAPDGWFRTGDLGVMHPDGYVEIRDRAKDVIVSGGENITSIEVEQALVDHPAVLDAAVVAMPDEKWGERPAAFVTLKPGAEASAEELVGHVRGRLARFKAPSPEAVFFGPLPKNSTGKVQKFVLREQLWAGEDKRVK
jgi:fatty-acyl-CoA synthase